MYNQPTDAVYTQPAIISGESMSRGHIRTVEIIEVFYLSSNEKPPVTDDFEVGFKQFIISAVTTSQISVEISA